MQTRNKNSALFGTEFSHGSRLIAYSTTTCGVNAPLVFTTRTTYMGKGRAAMAASSGS